MGYLIGIGNWGKMVSRRYAENEEVRGGLWVIGKIEEKYVMRGEMRWEGVEI